MGSNEKFSGEQQEKLLETLRTRFEKNMNRHKGLDWTKVQAKLEANSGKLWSLSEMEKTGGEPDVIGVPLWLPGIYLHGAPLALAVARRVDAAGLSPLLDGLRTGIHVR